MKLDKLPDTIDPTLNLDDVRQQARDLVTNNARLSAGAAVIPVPLLDIAIDAGLLSQLLPKISAMFQLSPDRLAAFDPDTRDIHWDVVKDRVKDFAGLVATRGIARKSLQGIGTRILSTQVAKFIPLGGQMVAAGMSYYTLRKIAYDFIDECHRLASDIQKRQHGNTTVINSTASEKR